MADNDTWLKFIEHTIETFNQSRAIVQVGDRPPLTEASIAFVRDRPYAILRSTFRSLRETSFIPYADITAIHAANDGSLRIHLAEREYSPLQDDQQ